MRVLTKSFAFACFTFRAPTADHRTLENRSGEYRVMDWATDVKSALQQLPSIDNVRFIEESTATRGSVRDDLLSRWGFNHAELQEPIRYGDLLPHPANGELTFQLRIPSAVRERLLRWGSVQSDLFEVRISYVGPMPVSVVVGNDPHDRANMIIPLVREFLKDEFNRRAEQLGGIEFEYLPPAPMHLQGQVYESESEEEASAESTLAVVPSRGYDRLEMRVPAGQTDAELEKLLETLIPEVALYYSLVGTRNYLRDVEHVLEAESSKLVSEFRAAGVKAYLQRIFGGYRAAANLQIMAVEAEQARKSAGNLAITARDEQERIAERLIIQPWIDAEIAALQRTQAAEVGRISGFISAGTAHSVQSLAVVGSAVMGGAAGAALTALLT